VSSEPAPFPPSADPRAGLCSICEHARRIHSDRGSIFYRCELSRTDPAFAAYPRLPVKQCAGFTSLHNIHR